MMLGLEWQTRVELATPAALRAVLCLGLDGAKPAVLSEASDSQLGGPQGIGPPKTTTTKGVMVGESLLAVPQNSSISNGNCARTASRSPRSAACRRSVAMPRKSPRYSTRMSWSATNSAGGSSARTSLSICSRASMAPGATAASTSSAASSVRAGSSLPKRAGPTSVSIRLTIE